MVRMHRNMCERLRYIYVSFSFVGLDIDCTRCTVRTYNKISNNISFLELISSIHTHTHTHTHTNTDFSSLFAMCVLTQFKASADF